MSGHQFLLRHAANSGAVLRLPETSLNMIRPGLSLYGHSPNPDLIQADLQPVMELKTRIIQVRTFHEGDSVSYGRTYRTKEGQKIAVVPIGYADGLHRVRSGTIDMLVHGRPVPQVGAICMDMCMLDVSAVEKISVGDVVTIFGQDGNQFRSIGDIAERAGTISYELLTAISPRVPRFYSP